MQYFESTTRDPANGDTIYIQEPNIGGEAAGSCIVGIVGGAILAYVSDGLADVWYSGQAGAWIEANCAMAVAETGIESWIENGFVKSSGSAVAVRA